MRISKLRSEISVGYMESCLLDSLPVLEPSEKCGTLLISADCGSTQTRISIVDLDNADFTSGLRDIFVIPSRFGLMTEFLDKSQIKSDVFYDNLQSRVVNNAWEEGCLVNFQLVGRATIMEDLGLVPNRMSSTKEKSEDPSLFINLIDAIGYALIRKYGGKVPKTNEIYLSLALPPEDLSGNNKDRLMRNLKKYKWSQGNQPMIELNFSNIVFVPEAEAFIQGYYALNDGELPEVSLHIEGGGRSISPALCRYGRAVNTARVSLPYGGGMLRKMIADEFYTEEQIHLSERQLDAAIETGSCKVGKKVYDLVYYIENAKDTIAKKIVSDLITKVFENLDGIRITDVEEITASGRLFAPGEYDMSLMNFVSKEFRRFAPNADFTVIEEPYINKG